MFLVTKEVTFFKSPDDFFCIALYLITLKFLIAISYKALKEV